MRILMARVRRWRLWMGVLLALLAACSNSDAAENTATPNSSAQVETATAAPQATLNSTNEAPLDDSVTLTVWWPETLAPPGNDDILVVLNGQLNAFQESEGDVVVESRLKRLEGSGGIMATLRTASRVAPGALPDLTLLRREDLLTAAQGGLIRPLEGMIPTTVLGDLYDSALLLGQVEGVLYGLPYALEVQHLVYDPERLEAESWRFEDVIDQESALLFPAGRSNGLADMFVVQYLAAGGTFPINETNAEALRSTLTFYEEALAAEVLDANVLNYSVVDDYQDQIIADDSGLALVTSALYLSLLEDGHNVAAAPIPTLSGQPTTILDGWSWVLTTSDREKRALALAFLSWMMGAEQQGQYNEVAFMIPSQRAAFRQWNAQEYREIIDGMLTNANLPLSASSTGTRAMQNALVSVLTGQRSAEEATQDVLDQFTD